MKTAPAFAQLLILGAVLAIAAASPAADKAPPPWEKPRESGRDLYRENCIVCHEIEQADDKGKLGPSLHRLFQNEKLPASGGVPNEPYVRVKIQFGGDVMPPFTNRLTDEEIGTIINYIRSKK